MDFLKVLHQLFSQKLPGWDAHKYMCPPFRDEQLEIFSTYQHEAAVGIILASVNHELHIIFIKRTNDGRVHAGQVAFPGGKIDVHDASPLYTAYREINEEIGVNKQHLHLVRNISSLYIPVSQFLVYPYVFFCSQLPDIKVNQKEVQQVLVYPVRIFYKKYVRTFTSLTFNERSYAVPCFKIDDTIIWGATAMIWNECLMLLKPLFYHE